MKNISEINIIGEIQKGNKNAFKKVYRCYYVSLCRFASKYFDDSSEAEDIVQETMVRIWEKRKEIIVDDLRVFLFSSVKNACLNRLKHLKVVQKYKDSTILDIKSLELQCDVTYMDKIEDEDSTYNVMKLLNCLPEKRKNILGLRYLEGLNVREIAEITNTSPRTVETHIYKGIKALRKLSKSIAVFVILGLISVFG